MLALTFLTICNNIGRAIPRLRPLAIVESEAKQLGKVWAFYINSFPSRKRKAAMEVIQKLAPSIAAFGTTLAIFWPRVDFIMRGRQLASAPEPPIATPTSDLPDAPLPPQSGFGPDGRMTRDERNSIIDANDLEGL